MQYSNTTVHLTNNAIRKAGARDGPLDNAVTAGLNTINSTNGNVEISNTPVTATTGNNTITADLGDVKIKDSKLDAKGDNTIKGNNVDIECSGPCCNK